MALYTLKSQQDVANMLNAPRYNPNSQALYNALGRDAGQQAAQGTNDNFFVKRGKSIENTLGTTLAAPVSAIKSGGFIFKGTENVDTENMLKDNKTRMNDVAKKFGYNTWNDWQDAYEQARNAGDQAAIKRFEEQNKSFQAQANANAEEANRKAANFKDYTENNYVSKKINQDRGKFAGSAINTLSTAADITGLSSTPLTNAIQGGVEGIADELEQNGLNDFDWGRAGQNALVGATTGAVTGALNKGISGAMAKRAAAKGVTNAAVKGGVGNAIKQGAKTIGTGAVRGALSGAVGGATGAGLQSALNNVEFGQGVQNALQGAVQGAKQGAISGGIMAGANMAISKTPGVGKFYNQLQNAKTNWDQSGSNFDERLTNTLTSGDSAVGDWLMNKRQSNVLGTAGNLGNKIRFDEDGNMVLYRGQKGLDDLYYNGDQEKGTANLEGAYFMTPDEEQAAAFGNDIVKLKLTPEQQKQFFLSKEQYAKLTDDAAKQVSDYDYMDRLYQSDPEAAERIETMALGRPNDVAKLSNKPIIQNDATDIDEMFVYKGINPEFDELVKSQLAQPTTAKGWAKKAGQRIVEDLNNSNLGNRVKDVSSDMPEDIRNMQIRDYNAYADGESNLTYQNALNRGLDQGLSGPELGDALAPYSNLPAKVTGPELYELAQNDPQLRMAASYVANRIADGGGNPSYSNVANSYWDEVRAQYAQAQNYNGPGDYFDGSETYEMAVPSGATRARATTPAALDAWDRVAQEAGYSNYDEVLQRYAEANPNAKINQRGMAGQVLSWMDQNPNTPTTAGEWAKLAGQRLVEDANNSSLGLRVRDVSQDEPSRRLYNALAGKQEPAVTETETFTEENVVPSRTSKEGKLRYARGKELLRQYGTVDQPMARASRAVESVQEIADAGFTKPEDVERMANVITGSNGEVSKLTRNLINSAKPVDTFTGENGQTLEEFVDNSIQLNSLYGTNKGNAVKQTIEANLRSLPSRAEGSVTYTDAPDKVFKVIQNLEASAAELEGRGGSKYTRPSIENIHQAAVLKDTASLLKQRLFDGADVSEALTPEVAQNLKSYDPKNEKYANWVDNTIMNAKSIDDLRAAQAPFVRMSKYIDNAYTQAATVGGRMAENANDLSRILTTRNGLLRAGIDALWNSNTARRGRAAVYDKLADKAANNPTTAAGWAKQAGQRAAEDLGNTNLGNRIQDVSGGTTNTPNEFWKFMTTPDGNPSTRLYNAIGRTEGALAQETPAQNLANAVQEAEIVPSAEAGYVQPLGATTSYGANTLESLSNPTSTSLYNTVYGTTNQIPTYSSLEEEKQVYFFPPTGDYWTDMISRAMRRAKDAEDYTAMDSLYAMYQNAQSGQQKSSNVSSWSSSDRSKLLSAQNALDQIDQLENAYYQATGEGGSNAIQGWLRSRASDISGGNWDPSASNYNNLAESIGMSIIKNLINLGVTESDAERYKKYIPSITDTKVQAATKLETLRNIYQDQINNLYSAYGA